MLFCRPQFDSLIKSARWVYLEVTAEAVDTRMTAVKEDVTRSIERRAKFTRDHLQENGFEDDYAGAGLAGVDKNSPDETLMKATIALQMKLFPGDIKEHDAMYGTSTFEAYRKTLTGAALDTLREKVQQAREARLTAEGPMVQHNQIADEIRTQYHITADVITGAERDCAQNWEINRVAEKPNFLRLVDYAARVTHVPPSAILATTSAEVSNSFQPTEFGPVAELGMGQFIKSGTKDYWSPFTHHKIFRTEMAKFTTQDPTTIGRARSIVADLLAIGIKLKQSERVVGAFDYDTQLNSEQLIAMRFHYHAPGYAAVYYGKANRDPEYKASADAAYKRYKARYERRFAEKAEKIDTTVREAIRALPA